MPVPTPRKGESERDFVSRCISELHDADPNRPHEQIVAMCYTSLRQREGAAMHIDFQQVFQRFLRFFKDDGIQLYQDFLIQHGLDDTKPYSMDQLFGESFEWTMPMIKYWKYDEHAKYYNVRLLTAGVSMNLNDYRNRDHMEFAAENLAWRPLNIDHNHAMRLPFPANRIEIGKVSEEGDCIEAVIRIDNTAQFTDGNDTFNVQSMIHDKQLHHPSIEAYPICGVTHEEDGRRVPSCGYYITETALLRSQYKLPGDPLSQIFPVPINEALAHRLVESFQLNDHTVESELQEHGGENKTLRGEKKKMNEAFGDASYPDSCFAYVPDSAKGAEGNKSDRKLPYKNKDGSVDIPHVRNALARLNQTDGLSDQETSRIRTMLQSILNRENPEGQTEESTEQLQKISALTENVSKLTEQVTTLELDNNDKAEQLAKLHNDNAVLTKETMKIGILEKHVETLKDDLITEKDRVHTLKGKTEEYTKHIHTLESEVNGIDEKNTRLTEQLGKADAENDTLRRELNEESQKRAAAEQKALNETNEKSRLQLENATLHQQAAKDTQKISELTDVLANKAKTTYASEKIAAAIRSENAQLKETLKRTRRKARGLVKILESQGYTIHNANFE